MDMSQSDLSRKLFNNPEDPRRFSVGDLESYVKTTGDIRPILYLAQKYCVDTDTKRRAIDAEMDALLPQIARCTRTRGRARQNTLEKIPIDSISDSILQ